MSDKDDGLYLKIGIAWFILLLIFALIPHRYMLYTLFGLWLILGSFIQYVRSPQSNGKSASLFGSFGYAALTLFIFIMPASCVKGLIKDSHYLSYEPQDIDCPYGRSGC